VKRAARGPLPRQIARMLAVAPALALLVGAAVSGAAQERGPAIEDGSVVRIEFTLRDRAGQVLQSTKGGAPITYTHGRQQLIPGLERALLGLRAGDEKRLVVEPEEGYGAADPAARAEVPRTSIPPEAQKVGAQLLARNQSGEERPVVIIEIRGSTVVLDLNHPLAGKTLHFDVKVLGVAPPSMPGGAPPPAPR
jgi:FKBP-type peptidyl-prolyl cis-trans isomerase SlyD